MADQNGVSADTWTEIEKLEAAIKAIHDEAWENLMYDLPAKTDEDLAIDAEAEEVDAFLANDPTPERTFGGWVHRAVMGTLPTFTTHQGVYAALPEKED